MAGPSLRIVWDGTAPGLDQRRLSLGAFAPALQELLRSVRRVASDLERDAWPTKDVQKAGRLRGEASNLDLQISTISANSPVTVDFAIVEMTPPERPLIADLPERAIERFLDDVRKEAAGEAAHYRVRKYLKALPDGLVSQRYIYTNAAGNVIQEFELGTVRVPETTVSTHLIEATGELVGAGFEPGKTEIKVRANSTGDVVTIAATATEVDEALALRGNQITILAVVEPHRSRLLRLGPFTPMEQGARLDYVFRRWAETLHRLAQ
jgi:hypothetical protein